ncbi:caveolae-associated protein 2a [Electrophorus electricus]|uniref:caveolae-associated protein 2a n=1 Tax=Electrophorus electricus TaxID=8005 RepID=UPI0015CF91EB|nr:caveolae-associated protein 2a [Electrophorus electricus]
MGEDSAHADRSTATLSGPASSEPDSTSTLPGPTSSEPCSTTLPEHASSESPSTTTLHGAVSSEPCSTILNEHAISESPSVTTLPGPVSSNRSSTILPGQASTNRKSATLPANSNRISTIIPGLASTDASSELEVEAQDILIPSFGRGSAPSSPIHTLTRRGSKNTGSPTGGQVSAITVVALLDQLVAMIEAVQDNQRRMEKRQVELEGVVRGVQGDVIRLAKSHTSTANSVAKLLERSRKTSGYVKEVRERLERQSTQVKRLEANHANLLKRNHFKVIIFQEDNEIPTTLLTKDSTAELSNITSPPVQDEMPASTHAMAAGVSHEEGLQTISLSSDEDEGAASPTAEGNMEHLVEVHDEELPGLGAERIERSRADKFKRSSLKKVDSLKKAFSRSSIEKKINKIVPPERREKIKKSFTPNHPKSPTSKSASFHVSPMTFNVKKVRDGDDEALQHGDPVSSPTTVEVPTMGEPEGQMPVAEVHFQGEQVNGQSSPGSVDGVILSAAEGDLDNGPSITLAKSDVPLQKNEENGHNNENGDDHGGDVVEQEIRPAPAPPSSAAVAIQQVS